jgi:hypothetical protein
VPTYTVRPTGQGGDYTTLNAAILGAAGIQSDLHVSGVVNIDISGDWTGVTDTTACTIAGFTNPAADHYLNIYCSGAALHDGTAYKTTVYKRSASIQLVNTGGGNYSQITDLVCLGTSAVLDSNGSPITGNVYNRCILHGAGSGSYGVALTTTCTTVIKNCIISGYSRGISADGASTAYAYNNTVYGCSYGILRCVAKNNYCGSNASADFYSLVAGSSNNVGSDTSGDIDNKTAYTDYFVSVTAGSENFHIKDASATLWGAAADLTGTFTDDIDGDTRTSGAFGIGADLYVAAVTGQFARPSSDVADGNWLNESASNTNLYASIDETTASDADYIRSGSSPTDDTCTVGLSAISTPDAGTVTMRIRARFL